MTDDVSVVQTGPLTFEAQASVEQASTFVREALSRVGKAVVTDSTPLRIAGHYKFAGGDFLIPFSIYIAQSKEHLALLELELGSDEPEWRTELIRAKIGEALVASYDTNLKASERAQSAKPSVVDPTNQPRDRAGRSSTQPSVSISPDYKTTSALGSFFAVVGWLGVALSVAAGLLAADEVGVWGITAGFIAAFFCLLTVAAGQLLRAQIEVANNSRLILLHLEKLVRDRE